MKVYIIVYSLFFLNFLGVVVKCRFVIYIKQNLLTKFAVHDFFPNPLLILKCVQNFK